jgi:hypothetical protein
MSPKFRARKTLEFCVCCSEEKSQAHLLPTLHTLYHLSEGSLYLQFITRKTIVYSNFYSLYLDVQKRRWAYTKNLSTTGTKRREI